jgi:hypothetical protein
MPVDPNELKKRLVMLNQEKAEMTKSAEADKKRDQAM